MKRNEVIQSRVSLAEKERLELAANLAGRDTSAWIREIALAKGDEIGKAQSGRVGGTTG